MLRGILVVALLCALAHAQGSSKGAAKQQNAQQKALQRLRELRLELRELPSKSPSGVVRPSDQRRIFLEIAKIDDPEALRALVQLTETPEYAPVLEDLLHILAEIPNADEKVVSRVMRDHVALGDPARSVALKFLLDQAVRRRRDEFPHDLFSMGSTEDKFLALQVMGRIGSTHVLACAKSLIKDRSWAPDETGLINCGTIALSIGGSEGPEAACALLQLAKDPRFAPGDAATVREATRTWRETNLRSYVVLAELSGREPGKREEAARFYGVIGFEEARAPLVRVALDRSEVPEVRAAAATALGGLRIAREDLAEQLERLLSDPDPLVRGGAINGLGRLNVRRAAEILVSALDGPYRAEVAEALPRLTNMPATTDWREWLKSAFPKPPAPLPPGPPPPPAPGGK